MVHSLELGGMQRKTMSKWWSQCLRLGLSETLATYVMMSFGLGAVAQVVTGRGEFGQYLSINLAFGLAVAFGIHVGGNVSGAHMNAAVSFSSCVFGTLKWALLPLYVSAQFLGSFLAAGTVYAVYYEAIHSYCEGNLTVTGPRATAGIFSTFPAPHLSLTGGFIDQVFGTAMLLLGLSALSDRRNCPAGAETKPIAVGLLVLLIGLSLGSNSGYAINPTRDLGPRVFTAIAGWGLDVFRTGDGWWWVPLVAPCLGSVLGVGLYKVMVELHHPAPRQNLSDVPSQGEANLGHELEERAPLEKLENCV